MGKFKAFKVGPLPIDKINAALGTELTAGDAWVSRSCHEHMAKDHPDDYHHIMAGIVDVVTSPLYVGQDPKHSRNFYVVRPAGPHARNPHALVAIGFDLNEFGNYSVRTAYTISQDDVDSRRAANRLHRAV